MHEQSQRARLRRALVARLARFTGGRLPADHLRLTAPERAALALRRARAAAAPAGAGAGDSQPCVTFAIPLVGRHAVSDWARVSRALTETLDTLRAQTDPRWRAIICGQDRPEVPFQDPRIEFLAYPERPPCHDQNVKLPFLARQVLPAGRPGHYMFLDADDLLSRHLVARLHAQPGVGLLLEGGYVLDMGTGEIGPTRRRSLLHPHQRPFWKLCGSCMALPVGVAPEAETEFVFGMTHHQHRIYPYLAELAGIPMRRETRPMAIYRINHGENADARRGAGRFKARLAHRYRIEDRDRLEAIAGEFGPAAAA